MEQFSDLDNLRIIESLQLNNSEVFKEIVAASRTLLGLPIYIDFDISKELESNGFLIRGANAFSLSEKAYLSVQKFLGENYENLNANVQMFKLNNTELYKKFVSFILSYKTTHVSFNNEELNDLVEAGVMMSDFTIHNNVLRAVIEFEKQDHFIES